MHRVSEIFKENNITSIAIIDDAYDPPMREDFAANEIQDFWEDIEDKKEMLHELKSFGININEQAQINNDILATLWSKKDELKTLSVPCEEHLFPYKIDQQEQLKPLKDFFQNHLELSEINSPCYGFFGEWKETTCNLIFIDHYLIEKKNSWIVTRELLKKYPDEKPLFILMSDRGINDEMIDDFKKETNLLGGMFHFISKEEFDDEVEIALHLSKYATSLPDRHTIQNFVDAVGDSIKTVSKDFINDIRKLSLDDYAYIQNLSLREEGHPLGDYMLWLYGNYFGHLLFEKDVKVRETQKELDSMSIDYLPLPEAKLSTHLADIYESAIFVSTEEGFPFHPIAGAKNKKKPLLHLGDIFLHEDNKKVFMVINAQCDLAYTPERSNRPFKEKRSILFLPGAIESISDAVENNAIKTELYKQEGEIKCIVWDIKGVESTTYGLVKQFLGRKKYKPCKLRLRLPFALEIQHAFASDLTRVGMPVAPPIEVQINVNVFFRDVDGKAKLLTKSLKNECFLINTRNESGGRICKCFVTKKMIDRFREELSNIIAEKEGLIVTVKGGEKTKLVNLIAKLKKNRANYGALKEIWTPFKVKKNIKFSNSDISFSFENNIDEGKELNNSHCLIFAENKG